MAELKFDITEMAEGFAKAVKDRGIFVGKWIPVETALPEVGQRVIATVKSIDGNYVRETICGKYGLLCGNGIAWMPLPEPYQSEIPTGQIVANGELYPGEFDDPLAAEGSEE